MAVKGWQVQDRMLTRLNALAATLTKTDRILTGDRKISVRMTSTKQSGVPAPGFSDGQTITVNYDRFNNVGSILFLVRVLGLNYHELSHILFTPRNNTELRQQVMGRGLGKSFNALEDMRIETLFTGTYKPAGKYFTEMVVEFFVEKQETWGMAHLLTHGRRFLPLEIRQEFAARFAGSTEDKVRVEEIIDEYRLLDLSNAKIRNPVFRGEVLALIKEYDDIMKRAEDEAGTDMPNPFNASDDGERGCGSSQHGETDDSRQRAAQQDAEEQTEEQDEIEEDGEDGSGFWDDVPEEDDEEDEENEDGSGSGSDGEDDEDSDSDDASGDGDDADEDGDDGEDSGEGDSEVGGDGEDSEGEEGDSGIPGEGDSEESEPGNSTSVSDSDLEDILNDVLNGVTESDTVQGDVRQLQNTMNDPNAFDIDGNKMTGYEQSPEPHVVAAFQSVQKEFRRLWASVEPGWKFGSDTGRLNVQRAMTSDDVEEWFDEWDEGREHDTGLEVVISVDTSGSMTGKEIQDACNALWIIKRACDELEATVSVMAFDVYTQTMYGRKDRIDRSKVTYFPANGGDTCPAQSFRNARRVLSQSEAPNKLFIIITDGGWSAQNNEINAPLPGGYPVPQQENLEELIKSIPGTTVFLGIGTGAGHHPSAGHFDVAKNVSHANEIAPLIKSAIVRMIRQSVR